MKDDYRSIRSASYDALISHIFKYGRGGVTVDAKFYKEAKHRFGINKTDVDQFLSMAVHRKQLKIAADSFGIVVKQVAA